MTSICKFLLSAGLHLLMVLFQASDMPPQFPETQEQQSEAAQQTKQKQADPQKPDEFFCGQQNGQRQQQKYERQEPHKDDRFDRS